MGETMVAAATLGSGSKRAGREHAIPKPPNLTPQTHRMEQKWEGVGLLSCGRAQERVCLKWSLILGGLEKQKSTQRSNFNKASSSEQTAL